MQKLYAGGKSLGTVPPLDPDSGKRSTGETLGGSDSRQPGLDVFPDVELGTVSAMHAFQRWAACCMEAAGLNNLSLVDILVLHHVSHSIHNRRLADICFILNIEDTHVVTYSLRKLIRLRVICTDKQGKDVTYAATLLGREYLARYHEIRERHLLHAFTALGLNNALLKELAQFLRKMSGIYDQAARAAASL